LVSPAYSELLRAARRWVKTPEDARDLVQTALAEALSRGFHDWEAVGRRGWLHGVIRRQAAFQARGEARRRRRDQLWQLGREHSEQSSWAWAPQFLSTLSPSLRSVALLVQAGLGGPEIRSVLRLTSVAFQQRLTALRRALATTSEATVAAPAPEGPGLGPRRKSVLAMLRRRPDWAVGSHDPAGHPLIFVAMRSRTGP
jgi:DNA-directed RNA polymerase specialized sigma24 family protein